MANGKRAKREVETTDYVGFARRILRAMGKRVSAGDVAALPELLALRDDLDRQIDETIGALRSEPWCYSWAQIGDALGITRQAAQKRFGHVLTKNARQVGGQPANLR
jgi:hypothetical protein